MSALPDKEISVTLVRQTLGAGTNSVGGLCTHANINKWSKYKPVRLSRDVTDGDAEWWKGDNKRCGLNYNMCYSIGALKDAYDKGQNDWTYDRPVGGAGSPYRLGDFRGYDHFASPPVANFSVPAFAYTNAPSAHFGAGVMTTLPGYQSLSFEDIGLGEWYFGVYFIKSNGAALYSRWLTETLPVKNGIGGVNVPIYNVAAGSYKVYPFLASEKRTDILETEKSSVFIPLPLVPGVVQLAATPLTIGIRATASGITLNYTVTIRNVSGDTIVLKNCYLTVKFSNRSFTDPMIAGEYQRGLGNLTVQGNSTLNLEDSIFVSGLRDGNMTIYFSSISPYSILERTMILSDMGGIL